MKKFKMMFATLMLGMAIVGGYQAYDNLAVSNSELTAINIEALTCSGELPYCKNYNYVMDRVTRSVEAGTEVNPTTGEVEIKYKKIKVSCCVAENEAHCPWEEQNEAC